MKVRAFLLNFIARLQEIEISVYAGQTAFFLMLSFFPFLLFFFSLLQLTPLSEEDFFLWTMTIIPDSFQELLQEFSHEIFAGSSGKRISITILTAVFLSSKGFLSLQRGLLAMYGTRETRNIILLWISSIFYAIAFAVILIAVLGLMVFGSTMNEVFFSRIPLLGGLLQWILQFRLFICLPVLFLFFWLLYVFLPNQKKNWKAQFPGAIFASAGWILFSFFFSIYVDKFSNYASFYGAMTTIALLMLWLYGCMYVLFIGGMINSSIP